MSALAGDIPQVEHILAAHKEGSAPAGQPPDSAGIHLEDSLPLPVAEKRLQVLLRAVVEGLGQHLAHVQIHTLVQHKLAFSCRLAQLQPSDQVVRQTETSIHSSHSLQLVYPMVVGIRAAQLSDHVGDIVLAATCREMKRR